MSDAETPKCAEPTIIRIPEGPYIFDDDGALIGVVVSKAVFQHALSDEEMRKMTAGNPA